MEKCKYQNQMIYASLINEVFTTVEIAKKAASYGELFCFGCDQTVIFKSGPKRRAHFAHKGYKCDYHKRSELFEKKFPLLNEFRNRLFDVLRKDQYYQIEIDKRMIENHWTDIGITFHDEEKLAIELDEKDIKYRTMSDMMEKYEEKQINVTWFILTPYLDFTQEKSIYSTIRLRLNKSSDHTVFLIDKNNIEHLVLCKLDQNEYIYSTTGELHQFKEDIFSYHFTINDLFIKDKKLSVSLFEEKYQEWLMKRNQEFLEADKEKSRLIQNNHQVLDHYSKEKILFTEKLFKTYKIPDQNNLDEILETISYKEQYMDDKDFNHYHFYQDNKELIEKNFLFEIHLGFNGNRYAWYTLIELMKHNQNYVEVCKDMSIRFKNNANDHYKILEKLLQVYNSIDSSYTNTSLFNLH